MSKKSFFRRCYENNPDLAQYIIPIGKPGVKISPHSSIKPEMAAKTPMLPKPGKDYWTGVKGWQNHVSEKRNLVYYDRVGANAGVRTDKYNVPDIDADGPIADAFEQTVKEELGPAPVKYRDNSGRRSLMYKLRDGEEQPKWRLKWSDENGNVGTFEWLGKGQQTVCAGTHSSGAEIKWRDGHPSNPGDLTKITIEQINRLRVRLIELLETYGYTLEQTGNRGTGGSSDAKKIGDGDVAPGASIVLDVLKAVPCNDTTFPTRDEFVNVLRSIKASLGSSHQEHWPAVLEWALQYPGAEADYIEKIWESFDDSALGWGFLSAWARGHGFTGDAQSDFADDQEIRPQPVSAPTENETGAELPNIEGPETAPERALKRYIYCVALDRFYDTVTHELMTKDGFNTVNTSVADYGSSGKNSAAAEFLNTEGARKVDTATYRVGGPLVVREGAKTALNLWRPSDFKPWEGPLSDDDVKPWLDHLQRMFGDGPSLRHLLDVQSFWVQNPGKKVNHALVIYGATQGTGKDSAFVPLIHFLGDHNVINVEPNMIASSFNDFLCAQLNVYNEMIQIEKKATMNRLKPWMAAPPKMLRINRKFAQPFDIPNPVNNLFFTNYADAINLDGTDRRFSVHEVELMTPMPQSYYDALHAWYSDGGAEKVIAWLMRRDISSFNPFAPPPMTDAKREMINQTMPERVQYFRDLIRAKFAGRTVLIVADLRRAAEHDRNAPKGLRDKHAVMALHEEGFSKHNHHRVRIDGDVRQLWVRDPSGPLSSDQIRERYLSERNRSSMGEAA